MGDHDDDEYGLGWVMMRTSTGQGGRRWQRRAEADNDGEYRPGRLGTTSTGQGGWQ